MTPPKRATAATAVLAVLVMAVRRCPLGLRGIRGLVLGGAARNLVDRLLGSPNPMRGHVVDRIDTGSRSAFNLADSPLVSAATLGMVITLRASRPSVTTHTALDAAQRTPGQRCPGRRW